MARAARCRPKAEPARSLAIAAQPLYGIFTNILFYKFIEFMTKYSSPF
jgi:hypothetical protein